MREWKAWGSRGAALEPGLNVGFGPFASIETRAERGHSPQLRFYGKAFCKPPSISSLKQALNGSPILVSP